MRVHGLTERLVEEGADHARDGLDEGRLELGELLDRDPVHVDDGGVDRPHGRLHDRLLGRVVRLDGGDGVLRCGDAAERVRPFLGRLPLQEDRRVAGVRDRLDDPLARREQPAYAAAGSSVSTIEPGFICGTISAVTGPRARSGTAKTTMSASATAAAASVISRPASRVRSWPAGEFST
jgi:hypothetical protein